MPLLISEPGPLSRAWAEWLWGSGGCGGCARSRGRPGLCRSTAWRPARDGVNSALWHCLAARALLHCCWVSQQLVELAGSLGVICTCGLGGSDRCRHREISDGFEARRGRAGAGCGSSGGRACGRSSPWAPSPARLECEAEFACGWVREATWRPHTTPSANRGEPCRVSFPSPRVVVGAVDVPTSRPAQRTALRDADRRDTSPSSATHGRGDRPDAVVAHQFPAAAWRRASAPPTPRARAAGGRARRSSVAPPRSARGRRRAARTRTGKVLRAQQLVRHAADAVGWNRRRWMRCSQLGALVDECLAQPGTGAPLPHVGGRISWGSRPWPSRAQAARVGAVVLARRSPPAGVRLVVSARCATGPLASRSASHTQTSPCRPRPRRRRAGPGSARPSVHGQLRVRRRAATVDLTLFRLSSASKVI